MQWVHPEKKNKNLKKRRQLLKVAFHTIRSWLAKITVFFFLALSIKKKTFWLCWLNFRSLFYSEKNQWNSINTVTALLLFLTFSLSFSYLHFLFPSFALSPHSLSLPLFLPPPPSLSLSTSPTQYHSLHPSQHISTPLLMQNSNLMSTISFVSLDTV